MGRSPLRNSSNRSYGAAPLGQTPCHLEGTWRRKLRDISLAPGLNIIWSPDGADDIAAGGQTNAIGHGSGKTLFCRLIRYCLGEDRFATEAQRERIGTALLNGLVGAEVILDGICWAIVRPLGVRRRHMAVSNGNLEEIAAGEGSSTGLEPFIQAIEQSIITPALADLIRPGTGEAVWPVALAWLTRDQECRFDDVLDWRSPASEFRFAAACQRPGKGAATGGTPCFSHGYHTRGAGDTNAGHGAR